MLAVSVPQLAQALGSLLLYSWNAWLAGLDDGQAGGLAAAYIAAQEAAGRGRRSATLHAPCCRVLSRQISPWRARRFLSSVFCFFLGCVYLLVN
jgi:hypothetical protein